MRRATIDLAGTGCVRDHARPAMVINCVPSTVRRYQSFGTHVRIFDDRNTVRYRAASYKAKEAAVASAGNRSVERFRTMKIENVLGILGTCGRRWFAGLPV